MLTINNFIPKINIPNIAQSNYRQSVQFDKNRYPNLAPLKYDTVSFGQTEKTAGDERFGISFKEAEKIHNDANESGKYLKFKLNKIFKDMIISDKNPNGIMHEPVCRIKSPKSIREKSATRRWINSDEVKSHMTDIVGARIILKNSSIENVDKVIARITKAEQNNDLQIIEIENYRPEPEIDREGNITHSYAYSSPNALRKLKAEIDKKGTMISKRDEDIPSGYMAIHLLTKLPNGFTGEIQIMGSDVAELKEIEDLCYKIKSGKSVDKKFASVEKTLQPLKNSDDTILRREFNNYTRNAYKYQRDKEPLPAGENVHRPFLAIPDYLPSKLDFNNIYDEVVKCEKNGNIEE